MRRAAPRRSRGRAARLVLALAALVTPAVAAAGPGKPKMTEKNEPVTIRYAGDSPGKPPLLRVQLDVVLRNSGAAPRWFLLPKSSQNDPGGVDTLQAYELRGKGRAVVGRFLGRAGFQAVLVPAGGEVHLHKLPYSHWGERPHGQLALEVRSASDFTLGGEPARSWFAADPVSDLHADASEDHSTALSTHRAEGGKEVPVALVDEQHHRVVFRVPRRPPR